MQREAPEVLATKFEANPTLNFGIGTVLELFANELQLVPVFVPTILPPHATAVVSPLVPYLSSTAGQNRTEIDDILRKSSIPCRGCSSIGC